ncbi:MAG: hypothetical protein U1F57_09695 [bacterium]
MPIKIGALHIEDTDHNDLFDPKIDEIKNEAGKVLKADSFEVKKTLAELGIPSLKGVHLSEVSQLKSFLEQARLHSSLGDPSMVQFFLDQIDKKSASMGIVFNEASKKDLLKNAYQKGTLQCLKAAHEKAALGEVEETENLLATARDYALKLETKWGVKGLFKEDDAKKTTESALSNGVENAFRKAEKYAQEGYSPDTSAPLGMGLGLLYPGPPPGSAGLPPWMVHTLGGWGQGPSFAPIVKSDPAGYVEQLLEKAKGYAARSGGAVAFDEGRADRARHQALVTGIDLLLDECDRDADSRYFHQIEENLERIEDYAKEADIPLDEERVEVLKTYVKLEKNFPADTGTFAQVVDFVLPEKLAEEINDPFKRARSDMRSYIRSQRQVRDAVKAGDVDGAEKAFLKGEEIAARLEEKFSISVGNPSRLNDVLDGASENRVDLDFKSAEAFSRLGNVEETKKALDKAFLDAQTYGVDYDQKREDAVLQEARKNRLENAFVAAETQAAYGTKASCLKRLDEAAKIAKEEGLPFDTARAAKIRGSIGKTKMPPFSFRLFPFQSVIH